MPNFYLVEQRGVPGARLIEAERPASAINHVIDGAFSAKRVDGRDLLDAAKLYEVEVAGAKPAPEQTPAQEEEVVQEVDDNSDDDQNDAGDASDEQQDGFQGHEER